MYFCVLDGHLLRGRVRNESVFVKIDCALCKNTIHAFEEAAGKQGECPVCETLIRIPATEPEISPDPQTPKEKAE